MSTRSYRPTFAFSLDAAGSAIVAAQAVPFAFPVGTVVFRSGDPCPGYVLLEAGELSVRERSESGREIQMYVVRPGEACLQTAVCVMGGDNYTAEGIVTQAARGAVLPIAGFEEAMAVSPAFRRMVMQSIAHRLRDFSRAVGCVAFQPLLARVADALLALADGDATITLTHNGLAGRIGASREAVSRALAALEREGALERARGRICVRDWALLRRAAAATS